MSAVTQSEIARYVEAVRAALDDLSPQDRDELLEDLPDHLAEVAAEDQGSLEQRLGSPAAYAAELRASAGLGGASGRARTVERAAFVVDEARRRLRRIDVRTGPLFGYEAASDFLRQLRPAWWVLRGYIAAMAATWILDGGPERAGLLPRLGGGGAVALVVLAVFVLGSIWLGRRSDSLTRWPRRLVMAGSALAVLVALVGFVEADERAMRSEYDFVSSNPYDGIEDVFVYDDQGRLLTNVRLFDQNGTPIQLGYITGCDWSTNNGFIPQTYPRCAQNAPFVVPSLEEPQVPSVPPSSQPTVPPTAGASPSPSAGAVSPNVTATSQPAPGSSPATRPAPGASPAAR